MTGQGEDSSEQLRDFLTGLQRTDKDIVIMGWDVISAQLVSVDRQFDPRIAWEASVNSWNYFFRLT